MNTNLVSKLTFFINLSHPAVDVPGERRNRRPEAWGNFFSKLGSWKLPVLVILCDILSKYRGIGKLETSRTGGGGSTARRLATP